MANYVFFLFLFLTFAAPLVNLVSAHGGVTYLQRIDEKSGRPLDPKILDSEKERPLVRGPMYAQLTASPAILDDSELTGLATVAWNGVQNASSTDWIGVYNAGDENEADYLDWSYVPANSASSGSGSLSFNLWPRPAFNSYIFMYFQRSWNSTSNTTIYILVGVSNTVSFPARSVYHTRLALASPNDHSLLWISWTSPQDSVLRVPVVYYGTSPDALSSQATGSQSHTYLAQDMCNAPATTNSPVYYSDPGVFYDVLLSELAPNTKYFYQVGFLGLPADTPIKDFTTPSLPGPDVFTKFVVYGDQATFIGIGGSDRTSQFAYQELTENDASFILHPGDLGYGLGRTYVWDQWMRIIENTSSVAPYMVGIGNHEYDYSSGGAHDPSGYSGSGNGFHPSWGNYGSDSNGECGVPTIERFHSPQNGNQLFWYSFDYQSVHVVMFSSEHNFTQGTPQYEWLAADLLSVNRSVTPWVVVTAHRPMYTSEKYAGDFEVSEYIKASLEDLFYEAKVDLAFWMHMHSYERTCPVYQHACCAQGESCTTHLVVGSAGQTLDNAGVIPNVTWSAFFEENSWGYGRATAFNRTHLLWEFLSNESGTVVDYAWLVK